jgi:uncharacterized RDD family membrane protein YckC
MIYTAPDAYNLSWEDAMVAGVLWRRCFAWLTDLILLALIVATIWLSFLLLGLLTFGLGWWGLSAMPLMPFAYHCLFMTSELSATPGQAMFGLIVRRDDDLGRPTIAQAVISTLIFYLTLATSGLLLLVALFTRRKRTLHDLIAGLVVVRRSAWRGWIMTMGGVASETLTGGATAWNMGAGHPPA